MTRAKTISAVQLTWPRGPVPPLAEALASLIRLAIAGASSQAKTAARLGPSPAQLCARMRRYGLAEGAG